LPTPTVPPPTSAATATAPAPTLTPTPPATTPTATPTSSGTGSASPSPWLLVVAVVALAAGAALLTRVLYLGRRRSLVAIADRLLGVQGVDLTQAGPASRAIANAVEDDWRAGSLLATIFWQAFTRSPLFADALSQLQASTSAATAERYVLCHGAPDRRRHDLVILDPGHQGGPAALTLALGALDLERLSSGWTRFRDSPTVRLPDTSAGRAVAEYAAAAASEAGSAHDFGIVITRLAPRRLTARCPDPPLAVTRDPGDDLLATAGVVVRRGDAQGVTTSLHAIPRDVASVRVAGVPAAVDRDASDPISDSAFLALSEVSAIAGQELAGPLTGLTPRGGETVHFFRRGAGSVATTVQGWSEDIPFDVSALVQVRVLTDADSKPGDSGSALVDGAGHVLGFALDIDPTYRHSRWIWAESVFRALGLDGLSYPD
jgi:hypothetical protein